VSNPKIVVIMAYVMMPVYDGVYYTVTEINSSAQLLRLNTN